MTIQKLINALSELRKIYGGEKRIDTIAGYWVQLDDADIWIFKNGNLTLSTEYFRKKYEEENNANNR